MSEKWTSRISRSALTCASRDKGFFNPYPGAGGLPSKDNTRVCYHLLPNVVGLQIITREDFLNRYHHQVGFFPRSGGARRAVFRRYYPTAQSTKRFLHPQPKQGPPQTTFSANKPSSLGRLPQRPNTSPNTNSDYEPRPT